MNDGNGVVVAPTTLAGNDNGQDTTTANSQEWNVRVHNELALFSHTQNLLLTRRTKSLGVWFQSQKEKGSELLHFQQTKLAALGVVFPTIYVIPNNTSFGITLGPSILPCVHNVITNVKETSVLLGKIHIGDCLLAINGVDVSKWTTPKIASFLGVLKNGPSKQISLKVCVGGAITQPAAYGGDWTMFAPEIMYEATPRKVVLDTEMPSSLDSNANNKNTPSNSLTALPRSDSTNSTPAGSITTNKSLQPKHSTTAIGSKDSSSSPSNRIGSGATPITNITTTPTLGLWERQEEDYKTFLSKICTQQEFEAASLTDRSQLLQNFMQEKRRCRNHEEEEQQLRRVSESTNGNRMSLSCLSESDEEQDDDDEENCDKRNINYQEKYGNDPCLVSLSVQYQQLREEANKIIEAKDKRIKELLLEEKSKKKNSSSPRSSSKKRSLPSEVYTKSHEDESSNTSLGTNGDSNGPSWREEHRRKKRRQKNKASHKLDPLAVVLDKTAKKFLASMGIVTSSQLLLAETASIATRFLSWATLTEDGGVMDAKFDALEVVVMWKNKVRLRAAAVGDVSLANLGRPMIGRTNRYCRIKDSHQTRTDIENKK